MTSHIFLSVIIIIGCITTVEDIVYSRIRNKWIILGLLFVLAAYIFLWAVCYINGSKIFVVDFDKWCVNLLISVVFAYALWRYKMWGGGDAKLFICYVALIPMIKYKVIYLSSYFPAFSLLIAIFIPAAVYICVRAFFAKAMHIIKGRASYTITRDFLENNFYRYFRNIVGVCVLILSYRIFQERFMYGLRLAVQSQDIFLLVLLFINKTIGALLQKKPIFFMAVIIIGVYTLVGVSYVGISFLSYLGLSMIKSLAIVAASVMLTKLVSSIREENLAFAPWMFLGVLITWFI